MNNNLGPLEQIMVEYDDAMKNFTAARIRHEAIEKELDDAKCLATPSDMKELGPNAEAQKVGLRALFIHHKDIPGIEERKMKIWSIMVQWEGVVDALRLRMRAWETASNFTLAEALNQSSQLRQASLAHMRNVNRMAGLMARDEAEELVSEPDWGIDERTERQSNMQTEIFGGPAADESEPPTFDYDLQYS